MLALYVRRKFREWLTHPSMAVPFYETVNTATNPQEDIWVTADFNALYREKMTYCEGSWMEEGDVSLIYNGLPGVGDEALIEAAEKDVETLMAFRDSPLFILTERSAVNDFSSGATNQNYQIEIIVSYQYQED